MMNRSTQPETCDQVVEEEVLFALALARPAKD